MSYQTEIARWMEFKVYKIKNDASSIFVLKDIRNYLRRLNLQSKTVIDGGSNTGIYSMYFSSIVGRNGFVHGFEIQKELCDLSEKSLVLNRIANVKFHHKALSSVTGRKVGFTHIDYTSETPSSVGVKTEYGLVGRPHCGEVETVALDDLEIKNIGLIKLDLEGHEPEALEGMWRTIDEQRPYMIIELTENYIHDQVGEIIRKLESKGYKTKELSDFNYCFSPL